MALGPHFSSNQLIIFVFAMASLVAVGIMAYTVMVLNEQQRLRMRTDAERAEDIRRLLDERLTQIIAKLEVLIERSSRSSP